MGNVARTGSYQMTSLESRSAHSDDYEAIAAAVAETERGRWFLAEHARRCRQADTATVLTAITTLEQSLKAHRDGEKVETMRSGLAEMARAIAVTHAEIGRMQPGTLCPSRLFEASGELDAIVKATEMATTTILGAAEKVQERAWSMRERGHPSSECDSLDSLATEIYAACEFQDITAQRTQKVIGTLNFVEERLKSMLEACDVSLPKCAEAALHNCEGSTSCPAPIWPPNPDHQAAIDAAFTCPMPPERLARLTHPASFAEMDALSLQERLRLFR